MVCAQLTDSLSPVYSYVFVDEGQDISPCEYELLRTINKKASFNIFGDIAQNVTPWCGIKSWEETFPDFELFTLNQNYRNTNQIVRFVAEQLGVDIATMPMETKIGKILFRVKSDEPLTAREREILELILQNKKRKDIAEEMRLSENTVKTYTRTLYSKIGVGSREELNALLIQN